jgi:hypothetical protein
MSRAVFLATGLSRGPLDVGDGDPAGDQQAQQDRCPAQFEIVVSRNSFSLRFPPFESNLC